MNGKKNELFNIQDNTGNTIKRIYGVSNEKMNKYEHCNNSVKYGDLVLIEENMKAREIFDKYSMKYHMKANEARSYEIKKRIMETNWKLRVLNERYPV